MELRLQKNVAAELMFPMVDSASPASFKSGLTVTDTGYYKDGAGSWTVLTITDTVTEIGTTGMYTLELTAGEMDHDLIMIKMSGSGAADSAIIIRTTPTVANVLQVSGGTTDIANAVWSATLSLPGQVAPSNTPSASGALTWMYKLSRNKTTSTSTLVSVFDDAGTTVDNKATVSDNGTTFTREEFGAGP